MTNKQPERSVKEIVEEFQRLFCMQTIIPDIEGQNVMTDWLRTTLTQIRKEAVEGSTKIYLDTEFNGKGGALISIALVSEDGREFYEALDTPPNIDPWVEENVIPKLNKTHILTMPVLRESLGYFLSSFNNPEIIADHPADLQYLNWLMSEYVAVREHTVPFTYTTKCIADVTGIVSEVPHNALEDARALMKTLQTLTNPNNPK